MFIGSELSLTWIGEDVQNLTFIVNSTVLSTTTLRESNICFVNDHLIKAWIG